MKYSYLSYIPTVLIGIILCFGQSSSAQCPGGNPAGSTAFDTTINTPTGINTLQIKFPKFDPQSGMLTCVRLCVSITGVVDSVSVENNAMSNETANIYYIRTDQITGPGLISPISNSVNYHYGPYNLGGTNGVPGSGPDFISISRDTILNAATVCRQINDSATIAQFYGLDSVTYDYNISAFTNISVTGGNYNSTVATSALVRFRFEYCTCPGSVLPINIYQFEVNKILNNQAEIKWNSFNNNDISNYHYEVEMSRNGNDFQRIQIIEKNANGSSLYKTMHTMNGTGRFYYRIRQVNHNGGSYFTNIKYLETGSGSPVKFIVYPNPSNGIVGIKFDNISAGKYLVLINNTLGQKIFEKEMDIAGNAYQQITTLQKGMYWVKLINVETKQSSVNQLLIK